MSRVLKASLVVFQIAATGFVGSCDNGGANPNRAANPDGAANRDAATDADRRDGPVDLVNRDTARDGAIVDAATGPTVTYTAPSTLPAYTPVKGPLAPWKSKDIGNVGALAGSMSYVVTKYQVDSISMTGGGTD